MSGTVSSEEIREFNLTYLLTAQRLISVDRETAMVILNVDSDVVDFLANLNGKQMSLISASTHLLCQPNFSDAKKLKGILDNSRDRGLMETHLSLSFSGESPATLPEELKE